MAGPRPTLAGVPRDHFIPAAFFGGFSNATGTRARKRSLWVAQRGAYKVFSKREHDERAE